MIFLSSAFLLGFLGSFHCGVMCGPIALAVARQAPFKRQLVYNFGRIVSYLIIGLVLGMFGKGLQLAGLQQSISILAGILLLLFYLVPKLGTSMPFYHQLLARYTKWLRQPMASFISSQTYVSRLLLGMVNGLLPCGLVYVASAGAIATGSPIQGMVYMLIFGMGTLPMMLGISYYMRRWLETLRFMVRKVTMILVVSIALLFIARGMNLGIKYISPDLYPNSNNEVTSCGD